MAFGFTVGMNRKTNRWMRPISI